MVDSFDKSAILESFVAEVHSYLPKIKESIESYIADPAPADVLEEGYRLAHTVKNSSLMMGYPSLSKIAQPVEEVLLDVKDGRTKLWAESVAAIYRALERAGFVLDSLKGEWVDEKRFVDENDKDFQELRQLIKLGKVTDVFATGQAPLDAVTAVEEKAGAESATSLEAVQSVEIVEDALTEPLIAVTPEEPVPNEPLVAAEPGEPAPNEMLIAEEPQESTPDGMLIAEEPQESVQSEMPTLAEPEEPALSDLLIEAEPEEPAPSEMPIVAVPEEEVIDHVVDSVAPEEELTESEDQAAAVEAMVDDVFTPTIELEISEEQIEAQNGSNGHGLPTADLETVEEPPLVEEEQLEAADLEPVATAESEVAEPTPALPVPPEAELSPTESVEAPVEAVEVGDLATEPAIIVEPPVPTEADGNSFMDVVLSLEEYGTYVESVLGKLEESVSRANQVMNSLMALKPLTINMSLLSERRYAQAFATAQNLSTPLGDITATAKDLLSSKQKLSDIVEGLEHAVEILKGDGKIVITSIEEESEAEPSPDQLAELRAEVDKEIRESLLVEMAAERELVERQDAERREQFEEQLRLRIEAEIRSELAMQFAHAAQLAAPSPTARTLAVSAPQEDKEDEIEELPQELVEAFNLEAQDHLLNISRDLSALEKSPGNADILRSIRRSVHTLKGAAATMGFRVTGELAHTLEDLLDQVNEGRLEVDSAIEQLILDTFNALETLVNSVAAGEKEDRQLLSSIKPRFESVLSSIQLEEDEGEETVEEEPDNLTPDLTVSTDSEQASLARRASLQVHVDIGRLDEVVNLVGELVISRATFEQRMANLKQSLNEFDLSTNRLKHLSQDLGSGYEVAALLRGDRRGGRIYGAANSVSRYGLFSKGGNGGESGSEYGEMLPYQAEFDELELDRYTEFHRLLRELVETTTDMGTVHSELETLVTQFDAVSTRQSRINSELQEKLMRLRLVPLANLTPRLYRAVRNVALAQEKDVDLVLEGEEIEVDKTVFEGISDPLLHLMRNAVDHGIEAPAERKSGGKAEKGTIVFQAYYEGNQVVIRVRDDGKGINIAKVRDAAMAKGLIRESDKLDDAQVLDLLFQPGFSTASEVSETSGRGVGLDVVRTNIAQLRGTVQVTSSPGQGTIFTVRLPLTLAVTRAQLIKVGNETFAVPLSQVGQILRLSDQRLNSVGSDNVLTVEKEIYPVVKLGAVLGLPEPLERSKGWVPVLIAGSGNRRVALMVDEIFGQQEIVIKALGDHFKSLRGFSGGTILGNGQVVLILNVMDFVEEESTAAPAPVPSSVRPAVAADSFNVLVVDDSPSVRRVVSNTLLKAGINSSSAKDGVEALELVQFSRPDVILLDVEMPRMDGYELLSILRSQSAYKDIPVVMLTSRAGNKHRQKAMQLGASGYLVKPYKDDELIAILRNLVSKKPILVS